LIRLIKLIQSNEARELDETTHYSQYWEGSEHQRIDAGKMEESNHSKSRLVEVPSLPTIEETEETEED
jgi:hypothetical protein